jgi:hypothetical protein
MLRWLQQLALQHMVCAVRASVILSLVVGTCVSQAGGAVTGLALTAVAMIGAGVMLCRTLGQPGLSHGCR